MSRGTCWLDWVCPSNNHKTSKLVDWKHFLDVEGCFRIDNVVVEGIKRGKQIEGCQLSTDS